MVTTVTGDGQVTIPKSVRDRLGLAPGSAVDFQVEVDGRVVLRKVEQPEASVFERWRGAAGPGLSTDEVMAITRGET